MPPNIVIPSPQKPLKYHRKREKFLSDWLSYQQNLAIWTNIAYDQLTFDFYSSTCKSFFLKSIQNLIFIIITVSISRDFWGENTNKKYDMLLSISKLWIIFPNWTHFLFYFFRRINGKIHTLFLLLTTCKIKIEINIYKIYLLKWKFI